MSVIWIVVILTLWLFVVIEATLLLIVFRTLGKIHAQLQSQLPQNTSRFSLGGLDIGAVAPIFTAIDQDGKGVSLNEFRKRKCLLTFIQPGCPVCKDTLEVMKNASEELQEIEKIIVGDVDHKKNKEYITENSLQLPIVTPASSTLATEIYRIPGIPFVFLLDEEGIIRAKGVINHRDHLNALLIEAFTPESISHEAIVL